MAMTGNTAVGIRRHASMTKLSNGGTPVHGTKLEAACQCMVFMLSIIVTFPLSILAL